MKSCLLIIILSAAMVCNCWGIDLNAPVEKKVTIKSEVDRGRAAMFNIILNSRGLDVEGKHKKFEELILLNRQQNTDTDPFLLACNLEAWLDLETARKVLEGSTLPGADDARSFSEQWAKLYYKEFRGLQRKLGIDDKTMFTELRKLDEKIWKPLIYKYDKEMTK